jgi:hypothetical protein
LRCWGPLTQWHSIISRTTLILSNTDVKTANLIKEYSSVLFHCCHLFSSFRRASWPNYYPCTCFMMLTQWIHTYLLRGAESFLRS